jgi:hypothetical protein
VRFNFRALYTDLNEPRGSCASERPRLGTPQPRGLHLVADSILVQKNPGTHIFDSHLRQMFVQVIFQTGTIPSGAAAREVNRLAKNSVLTTP